MAKPWASCHEQAPKQKLESAPDADSLQQRAFKLLPARSAWRAGIPQPASQRSIANPARFSHPSTRPPDTESRPQRSTLGRDPDRVGPAGVEPGCQPDRQSESPCTSQHPHQPHTETDSDRKLGLSRGRGRKRRVKPHREPDSKPYTHPSTGADSGGLGNQAKKVKISDAVGLIVVNRVEVEMVWILRVLSDPPMSIRPGFRQQA